MGGRWQQDTLLAGAGIGALAGALIGGVIGSAQHPADEGWGWTLNCTSACGVTLGAPAGFLLGGVIGALIKSDRWRPVSVSHLRMSLEPRLDALGLKVSVAF